MLSSRKIVVCFVLAMISCLVSIAPVRGPVMNFPVQAGELVERSIILAVEDRVSIRFTVVGTGSESVLDFWIVCPNGTVKEAASSIGSFTFSFVCDDEGEYILHFSNPAMSANKLVSLNYEVQHYIFGMPQMLFMAIVIVGVSVAAVGVFVFMGKPR
jgi:hypothetical protein